MATMFIEVEIEGQPNRMLNINHIMEVIADKDGPGCMIIYDAHDADFIRPTDTYEWIKNELVVMTT